MELHLPRFSLPAQPDSRSASPAPLQRSWGGKDAHLPLLQEQPCGGTGPGALRAGSSPGISPGTGSAPPARSLPGCWLFIEAGRSQGTGPASAASLAPGCTLGTAATGRELGVSGELGGGRWGWGCRQGAAPRGDTAPPGWSGAGQGRGGKAATAAPPRLPPSGGAPPRGCFGESLQGLGGWQGGAAQRPYPGRGPCGGC